MDSSLGAEKHQGSRWEPRRLVRFLFSREYGEDHLIARWLFLRCLGAVYFSAFFALLFQAKGLIGSHGILPMAQYLAAAQRLGAMRFWFIPSLFWMNHSDAMLMGVLWAGLIASILVIANVTPRPALLICWLCFLAFVCTARDFSEYQSDAMLLEAGFLSLFVAPAGLLPGWGRRSLATRAGYFLLLWEWFRIYFESGVVKLASGDPTWRNLTAMYEYYQNGPLPTWVGWYLQHLPHWFQKGTAGATLIMELVFVWIFLFGRRWRIACFFVVTAWQIGVILTANYAFLNYLVLVLGILLVDDRFLLRFVPARWNPVANLDPTTPFLSARVRKHLSAMQTAVAAVLLTWIAYAGTVPMILMLWHSAPLPTAPLAVLQPFQIANEYGLFANMTPHRYEIEFQGSNDGRNWTAYSFRYKPQDPAERPRIYAPYQPRYDWNLWFASLGSWEQYPIVPRTEVALLNNDADVLGLFRSNPFPNTPPTYVRAVLWQYWFSTPAQKKATGVWWTRKLLGTYAPTLTRMTNGRYGVVEAPTLSGPPDE